MRNFIPYPYGITFHIFPKVPAFVPYLLCLRVIVGSNLVYVLLAIYNLYASELLYKTDYYIVKTPFTFIFSPSGLCPLPAVPNF